MTVLGLIVADILALLLVGRIIYNIGFRHGFDRAYWLDPYRYILSLEQTEERKLARRRDRRGTVNTNPN